MKYPVEQFETLIETLKTLSNYINIRECNPSTLHYLIFQQFSEGQTHNHLYCINSSIKKAHQLTDIEKKEAIKLIDTKGKHFLLYPIGCHDTHIETAVKKAIKQMYN